MEPKRLTHSLQIIRDLAILIGIGVLGVIILNYTTDIFRTPRVIEKQISPSSTPLIIISDYPDYEATKNMKSLSLANDFESWTPDANIDTKKVINTVIVEKGSLAKGYLYVKASLNEKPLTQWESIYVKMNSLGGHLFRPQSLPVPPADKTELLFALNDVPYIMGLPYSEQKMPARVSWFGLFKDKQSINVVSFISSLRQAKIDNLILFYQCIDDSVCELKLK